MRPTPDATHVGVVKSGSGTGNTGLRFGNLPGWTLTPSNVTSPSLSPPCPEGRADGLTDAEGEVLDALSDAVEAFAELPVQHPSDEQEFLAGIHRLQDLIAVRIARRLYPEGWVNLEVHPEDEQP